MASDQIMHGQPEFLGISEEFLLARYMDDELCQLKPNFDIPSKIRCNVFSIKLKEVEIPTPKPENNIQNINYFTKVLSASDTSKKGSFVLNKRHAIECLPLLDTSKLTPSQEVIAKDMHGHEWKFKHTLRGTPQRHLFTSGWNDFSKRKDLDVGDSFVFLRGENGESRVGIRKAAIHQQHNKPSSLISKQSMHHGIVATPLNAVKRKCMFVVFYKPRSSQFLVNFDKFIDGVNKKFSIGSRFLMKFEGRDFNEIRYNEMKLQQFQDLIKYLHGRSSLSYIHQTFSNQFFEKINVKEKYMILVSSNMWVPTLTQGQEIGQSSIQSLMSYSFPTMSKPNYNEQMVQAVKETPTTTATTRYKLFGVDLPIPAKTKDPIEPIESYKKSKISKIFVEEKVDDIQTKSHTKLIEELERIFDIKGKLHTHNQWKIFFIDADGDTMVFGDDLWLKFCNMAKEIFICSKNDAKIGNAYNKFPEDFIIVSEENVLYVLGKAH
ncbi:hypothetical protein YC2023_084442 [Brassica napus]